MFQSWCDVALTSVAGSDSSMASSAVDEEPRVRMFSDLSWVAAIEFIDCWRLQYIGIFFMGANRCGKLEIWRLDSMTAISLYMMMRCYV